MARLDATTVYAELDAGDGVTVSVRAGAARVVNGALVAERIARGKPAVPVSADQEVRRRRRAQKGPAQAEISRSTIDRGRRP